MVKENRTYVQSTKSEIKILIQKLSEVKLNEEQKEDLKVLLDKIKGK